MEFLVYIKSLLAYNVARKLGFKSARHDAVYFSSALEKAVYHNDLAYLSKVLASDRAVNPVNSMGYRNVSIKGGPNALMLSIELRRRNAFEMILDHCLPWATARVDLRDPYQNDSTWAHTAITAAAMYDRPEFLRRLIELGCQSNSFANGIWNKDQIPVSSTKSALDWACHAGSIECTNILLQAGANLVFSSESLFWTPAICAAESGSVAILELLINSGVTIDSFTRAEDHALFAAARSSAITFIDVLRKNGISINTMHPKSCLTALKQACIVGDLNVCEHLHALGAEVDIPDDPGDSALAFAAANGHIDIVSWLIRNNARIDPPDENKHLNSPLSFACRSGHVYVVSALLAAGADPNRVCGIFGTGTPLWAAIKDADNVEVVLTLLSAGADPLMKLHGRHSALDVAISKKRENSIRAMKIANSSGPSPL